MKPRKYSVRLVYNGAQATDEISPYLNSFSYKDGIDESDTVSITLLDRDGRWTEGWIPQKEDLLNPDICLEGWNSENDRRTIVCGSFMVDDFSFSGPPDMIVINGISSPLQTDFKETKRSQTWKDVTIRQIEVEIAGKYGLSPVFEGTDVKISKMEQSSQTDADFLKKLAEKYGFAMKVYSSRLILFERSVYEEREPVCQLTKEDVRKWSCKSSMLGTYTGAKVSYTDPKTKQTTEIMVGTEGRVYRTSEKADSPADAELIGKNAIRNANRRETTISLTLNPPASFFASENISLTGFGKLDGIYQVEKLVHQISTSDYSVQVSGWKIRESDNPLEREKAEGDSQERDSEKYEVDTGDTLWDLAERFYGDKTAYMKIYEANQEIIEKTAKEHGKENSANGYWLWKGTVLTIP